MTVTEQSPGGEWDAAALDLETTGEPSTLSVVDATATLEAAATPAEWVDEVQNWLSANQADYPPAVSSFMEEAVNPVTDAVNDGIVPPQYADQFYFWLEYSEGVPVIPAVDTYAFVQGYVMKWAAERGFPTMGPYPGPVPTPQPEPTPARKAVVKAVTATPAQTVSGPGLDAAQALQVQKAIGAAYVHAMTAVEKALTALLPGMAPGQVPEALAQLNVAASALEHQVQRLRLGVGAKADASLAGEVATLQTALDAVQASITALKAQMAGTAGSGLSGEIRAVGDATTANGTAISGIEAALPGLATVGALNGLADRVNTVDKQLALVEPSALDTALNATTGTADDALAAAKAAQECCDEVTGNVNQATNDVGGKSAWKKLGGLAEKALVIGFAATLAETLLAILDAKAVVSAVVADTETIAKWATEAAGVIEADLSWQGKLGRG